MAAKLLLLEDVDSLGRSGEVVTVRPGYARNFLIPRKLAVTANKQALHLQERLQEKRKQQALLDLKESQAVAERFADLVLLRVVKVDHEGRMYGSVTVAEISQLLLDNFGIEIEKKSIQLKHPIKTTGLHLIEIKLKEGVVASLKLSVMSEEAHRLVLAESENAEKNQ